MPANFDKCVADGGKVITKSVKPGENYMHICYPKGGGTAIPGEEKQYKKLQGRKTKQANK